MRNSSPPFQWRTHNTGGATQIQFQESLRLTPRKFLESLFQDFRIRPCIPDDIIPRVNRATLWTLVYTAGALNMSGITDPYEFYILPRQVRVWEAALRSCNG